MFLKSTNDFPKKSLGSYNYFQLVWKWSVLWSGCIKFKIEGENVFRNMHIGGKNEQE